MFTQPAALDRGMIGKLTSTTDMQQARLLGRRLTVRDLIGGARVLHVERPDRSTLVLVTSRELYELTV